MPFVDDDVVYVAGIPVGRPSLFASDDVVRAPSIRQIVAPSLEIDADSSYAPAVSHKYGPTPRVLSDDRFYVPECVPWPVETLPGLVTDTETFFVPTRS